MHTTHKNLRRISVALAAFIAASLCHLAPSRGDTLISGFEGDLSTTLGVPWVLADTDGSTPGDQTWTSAIVTQGVTEGTQAVQLNHPIDLWQAGLLLNTPALIDLVETHDSVSFDVTASPDATWRGVWFVMQGDGQNWTQSNQIDVLPGITSTVTFDLTPWKAGAAASGGTWWQALIVFMGGDAASPETFTIVDNFRFVGSAPASPADFNGDGDVDGEDLAEWKLGFGADGSGDADGDLDTDGEDFLIWQREQNAPTAPVAAIPEPTTMSLAAAAAIAGYASLARRRRDGLA